MKRLVLAGMACMMVFASQAQTRTIQEKLGYAKDARLLIIHADDLGVSHSENEASILAMKTGSVSSASMMVPTPWFSEIASYAASHPNADLGLHLTLTSEWKYYKWSTVAGRNEVPGLLNKKGYMFSTVDSVHRSAKPAEVETELKAQIEMAKKAGIDFTHFDSHMGTLYGSLDYLKVMINLGREYKVPVMINQPAFKAAFGTDISPLLSDKDVQVDAIFMANPQDFKSGMAGFYKGVISNLKPGLNLIILHSAFDNDEMKSITADHPDYGAAWRQADFEFFNSETCKNLLKEQKIQLVTWREVRDKLVRK
ncbi:MAG: polysaccharide deacetylase family protein [Bacteroidetes bacterium]|nr:polysaccharide deacetylase family protein [Bacteroidota bacterium]